jgi:hypothetical protein
MDWLGLVLELHQRPARRPAAGTPPALVAGTIVQQYRPATADQWRLRERRPELRLEPELVGDLLDVPVVL